MRLGLGVGVGAGGPGAAAEPTPANLIDNGTFDSDDGWTLADDATIAAGKLTFENTGAGSGTAARDTNAAITEGAFYSVAFDVSDLVGTSGVTPSLGGTSGTLRDADASYSEYIKAGSTQEFLLIGTTSLSGNMVSVDNVVVTGPIETPLNTELVANGGFDSGAGWTLGGSSPMSISGGLLVASGGSGTKTATRAAEGYPLTDGTYRVIFTLVSRSAGTALVSMGGAGAQTTGRTVPDTYSEDIVVSGATDFNISVIATSGSVMEIDNVSVKRIA